MFSEKELEQLHYLVTAALETNDKRIDGFSDDDMEALYEKLASMHIKAVKERQFYASLKMPSPEDCDHIAGRTEVQGGGWSCGKCGGLVPPR